MVENPLNVCRREQWLPFDRFDFVTGSKAVLGSDGARFDLFDGGTFIRIHPESQHIRHRPGVDDRIRHGCVRGVLTDIEANGFSQHVTVDTTGGDFPLEIQKRGVPTAE